MNITICDGCGVKIPEHPVPYGSGWKPETITYTMTIRDNDYRKIEILHFCSDCMNKIRKMITYVHEDDDK